MSFYVSYKVYMDPYSKLNTAAIFRVMRQHVLLCLWVSKLIGSHKITSIFEFLSNFPKQLGSLLSGKHYQVSFTAVNGAWLWAIYSNGDDFSLIFNYQHDRVCKADQKKLQYVHVRGYAVVHWLVFKLFFETIENQWNEFLSICVASQIIPLGSLIVFF